MKTVDQIGKDVLLMYQGGGYDGCFWEWNFCYIDEYGKLLTIWASGVDGCKTIEDMDKYIIKNKAGTNYHFIGNISYFASGDMEDDPLKEFLDKMNDGHAIAICEWFAKEFGWEFHMDCSKCKKEHPGREFQTTSYHGDGGIGVIYTDKICEECYLTGCCSYCGEFVGAELLKSEEGYCEDCNIKILEHDIVWWQKILKENLEFGNEEGIKAIKTINSLKKKLNVAKEEYYN